MSGELPAEPELVTHYIKIYPDRFKLIQYRTPYSGFVQNKEFRKSGTRLGHSESEKADIIESSLARTRTKLSDLTICNRFDLFVTFTLNCRACVPKCRNNPCTCDKTTCKRFDLSYAISSQKAWYNNQIKHLRKWPYIQVMELHAKGGYHFHALLSHYPGRLRFAKNDPKDGRAIYNLVSNRKGWTTAKKIYDPDGTSSYIRKYIEKNMPVFPGKKRIWVSQGLRRPIVVRDEVLREVIIQNPDTEVYRPPMDVKQKDSGFVTDNLESISTLIVGKESPYYTMLQQLSALNETFKGVTPEFDIYDPFDLGVEKDD